VFQAQCELGVLLTEPHHRDMERAVSMFEKAAEQQVPFNSALAHSFITALHRA